MKRVFDEPQTGQDTPQKSAQPKPQLQKSFRFQNGEIAIVQKFQEVLAKERLGFKATVVKLMREFVAKKTS